MLKKNLRDRCEFYVVRLYFRVVMDFARRGTKHFMKMFLCANSKVSIASDIIICIRHRAQFTLSMNTIAKFTTAFAACSLDGLQVPAQRPALSIALCQSLAPGPQEPLAGKHQIKSPYFHRNFTALVSSVNCSRNITSAGQQAMQSLKPVGQGAGYGHASSGRAVPEPPRFVSTLDLPNSASATVFFPTKFFFRSLFMSWLLWLYEMASMK